MQTDDLIALGFGITGDVAPNGLQPAVGDGNHIRCMPSFAKGPPWYGLYLLRRPHSDAKTHCLARYLVGLKPGSTGSTARPFPGVLFQADDPIAFEDGFPATGTAEIALPPASALDAKFDPAPVHYVAAKIGFRSVSGTTGRICGTAQFITGGKTAPAAHVVESGVAFSAPAANAAVPTLPLRRGPFGNLGALIAGAAGDAEAQMQITLPVPSEYVVLVLSHPDGELQIRGYDGHGTEIAAARRSTKASRLSILTVSQPGLMSLRLATSHGALGVYLVFYCSRERPPVTPRAVRMIARDDQVIVAETLISGQPGSIESGEVAADRITSVSFEPAPDTTPAAALPGVDAVLVDLCWDTVTDAKGSNWGEVPNYPYPMALPVADPGYPCLGKPANQAAAEAAAIARVRYGPAAAWAGARFADLTAFLQPLVAGGPSAGAMNTRTASFTDPQAGPNDPNFADQNLLQLLQLAQLDPAAAQVLGFYWLDDQVTPGQGYDYYALADHANAFNGQVGAALAAANGTLPAGVDGWITFNHVPKPRAPLAPPGAPAAWVLPDTAINGAIGTGRGAVGLRWNLPSTGNYLVADAAVRYIAWRHDYGDPAPTAPATGFVPRNPNAPFLPGDGASAAAAAIQPANWPAVTLSAIDRQLGDGWYGYGLSGIDIWGRHSAVGAASEWRQPATPPDPLPWYYQNPPGDRQLHPYAVNVRDQSRPPSPSGVEATALDPEDDLTYTRDQKYLDWAATTGTPWWNALTDAERAAALPLRVRWRWYPSQEQDHPETVEFRIYFNPDSVPPGPDRFDPVNWQQRVFVCDYDKNFTLVSSADPDGPYRQYDVLLPATPDPNGPILPAFPGIPLAPSLAVPVVYANISVAAADARPQGIDDPKWNGTPWGGRIGKQGPLAAPAKIYRVWRALPPAPAALINDDRVWATRADYHRQSFYSFRWAASPQLMAHVYAVMDSTLFTIERESAAATTLTPDDIAALETVWNPVPTNVTDQLTALRALKPTISDLGATAAQIKANAETWAAACAALGDGALHGLAVLPLHEDSYIRQTSEPVDPPDAPGPDDSAGYAPNPQWRMYRAMFDGWTTSRYFLRAAYIDAAHNEGPLGPPTPPIYFPPVIPPVTPVITSVKGGDRSATITWTTANAGAGGKYLLYRTDDDYRLRDVRLMDLAVTIQASSLDPSLPSAQWTDHFLPGGRTWHYCLVFVDSDGNASVASRAAALHAPDERPPAAPSWTQQAWMIQDVNSLALSPWPLDGVVPPGSRAVLRLDWETSTDGPRFIISRADTRRPGWTLVSRGPGTDFAGAQPHSFFCIDPDADPAETLRYRIRVANAAGTWSLDFATVHVFPPDPPPPEQ